jgi:hypothetical protein
MGSPNPGLIDHTANSPSHGTRVRTTHGPGNSTIPGASTRRNFVVGHSGTDAARRSEFRSEPQLTVRVMSSSTNEVCKEESSVPVRLMLVVPAGTVKLFITKPVFLFRLE